MTDQDPIDQFKIPRRVKERAPLIRRLKMYLLLLGVSIFFPLVLVLGYIMTTGDQITALVIGLSASLFLMNFLFGLYFLSKSITIRLACGLFVTLFSIGVSYAILESGFNLAFDQTGIWTLLGVHFLASVGGWEIIHWFFAWDDKVNKK